MESDGAVTSEKHWFAFYTKPHKEYLVHDLLHHQGIEVYMPEIRVASRRCGRRERKAFFPQYLFARLDPCSALTAKVRWTPGLCRIISAGDQLVPVPN